jgi:hypothetical protein
MANDREQALIDEMTGEILETFADRGLPKRHDGHVDALNAVLNVIASILIGKDCETCRQHAADHLVRVIPNVVAEAMRKAAEIDREHFRKHLH